MTPIFSESVGFPSGYFIYPNGLITSIKSGSERCLSQYIATVGYMVVGLRHKQKQIPYYVHRLLAVSFIPNPQGKPQVNHKDGNKLNNSLDNLEWCTDRENKLHMHRTGLFSYTEKCRQASRKNAYKMIMARRRFTNKQVEDIKRRHILGEGCRAIARYFSCDHSIISRICTNSSYKTFGDSSTL